MPREDPPPRKKSCHACRVSKTRCDLDYPQCARCLKKGIACSYDGSRNSERRRQYNAAPRNNTPSQDHSQSNMTADDLSMLDLEGLYDAGASFAPSEMVPAKRQYPLLSEKRAEKQTIFSVGDTGISLVFETDRIKNNEGPLLVPRFDPTSANHVSLHPRLSSISLYGRFFHIRKTLNPTASLRAHYIAGILQQWPKALAEGSSLPPIIHPSSLILTCPLERPDLSFPEHINSDTTDSSPASNLTAGSQHSALSNHAGAITNLPLPETFQTLQTLCKLFYTTSPHSPVAQRHLWGLIKLEQERLLHLAQTSDATDLASYPTLLYAGTATVFYILLRLLTGPNEYNDFDMALIFTLAELAVRHSRFMDHWNDPNNLSGPVSWEMWTLTEMSRRSAVLTWWLYQMLELGIMMQGQAPCVRLDQVVLPSGRTLWECTGPEQFERARLAVLASQSQVNASDSSTDANDWTDVEAESAPNINININSDINGLGSSTEANDTSTQKSRSLLYGDLRHLRPSATADYTAAIASGKVETLKRWCADVDEFGNVIMACALFGLDIPVLADYHDERYR